MEETKPKIKRAPSAWNLAIQAHIKAGGKMGAKGTEEYNKIKKIEEEIKAKKTEGSKEPAAAPKAKATYKKKPVAAAPAPAPAPEPTPTPAPTPAPSPKPEMKEKKRRTMKAKPAGSAAAEATPKSMPAPETPDKNVKEKVKKVVKALEEVGIPAEKSNVVVGREVTVAHAIPLFRVSGGGNVKLPFS